MDIKILTEEEPQKKKNFLGDLQYLLHLGIRSFLIAVFCFLIIIAVIFTVYCVDLFANTGKSNSKAPLFNAYVIVSPSMVPTINVNDAIVIKRSDEEYKIGDIITFLSSDINYQGMTITHRVVDKGMGSGQRVVYTTKGDNNKVSDPATVSNEAIFGKVLFKIPKIGYIHSFLSKPSNFFLCILVPALIVMAYDFIKIAKMMSEKEEII